MALKRLFVDIQGDILDMWDFKSAEKDQEYNETRGDIDYLLIINKTAVTANVKEKIYKFQNEDERDEILYQIKDALTQNPNMYFLGEDDGGINDEELEINKLKGELNRMKRKSEDDDSEE